jgi:purine nucleoside phosphorylase
VGLVLGSGLGGLADSIADAVAIPFGELPGWPAASAPGHRGRLLLGTLEGVPVACLQGRLHMYEGLDAAVVVEPVLLLGRLGAEVLVLTNASGGVNPAFGVGVGPRFLDLTAAWNPELRDRRRAAARAEGVPLAEGIYAGLLGPTYETPAEVRMLRGLGADAVGQSTVMEVIAARWAGMRVCGVSLVTNPGAGLSPTPLSHEEVLEAAEAAGPGLARVLARFVRDLASAA